MFGILGLLCFYRMFSVRKMIIVNNSISPDNSLYYAGALILKIFQEEGSDKLDLIVLFNKINKEIKNFNHKKQQNNKKKELPFINYILALNWLFLLESIKYNNGLIEYVAK